MRNDLDFNLFKTLIVLAEKQNLKKTGIALGITESAVSKQLTRLREHLNDDLFVRMSGKLEPTAYTISILPRVRMAVSDLEEAVTPVLFEPSTYTDPIHIAMPDLLVEKFGIGLYEQLLSVYPNTSITIHSWSDDTEKKILEGGINLGIHLLNPDRTMSIYQQKLSSDQLVIATAARYGKYHWDEVKHWPFIKQRSVGWNEQKFKFIDHLQSAGINLNYAHEVDTASFALKLMASQKVANVLPRMALGEDFSQVEGSECVSYDAIWASNTRLTERKSPVYQHLHKLISTILK